MEEKYGKNVELSLDAEDELYQYVHALDSQVRIRILRALDKRSMNVGELAQELEIPMSSAALAVKILEEAGLLLAESQPGVRGAMKICSRKVDTIRINLVPEQEKQGSEMTLQMPIGGYSAAQRIEPTCGIAGEQAYIGEMDDPNYFYDTERFGAQLIWFKSGMLEYRFSVPHAKEIVFEWLELSFEACSEAPMHRDPWKSDISVSINGHSLGVWTSPADCGGRRGKQTPQWWPELSTQFGYLKTWRVDADGCYLDNVRIADTGLEELELGGPYISVCIGVEVDAENVGGMNLFGEGFGDYAQPIVLRIGYRLKGGSQNHSKNYQP